MSRSNPTPLPLEVLVAERVLGWALVQEGEFWAIQYPDTERLSVFRIQGDRENYIAHRLRSWSGLGLVVEAMEAKGFACLWNSTRRSTQVIFGPTNCLRSRFDAEKGVGEDADRFRAAFAAALRALGVDEAEIQAALEVSP